MSMWNIMGLCGMHPKLRVFKSDVLEGFSTPAILSYD